MCMHASRLPEKVCVYSCVAAHSKGGGKNSEPAEPLGKWNTTSFDLPQLKASRNHHARWRGAEQNSKLFVASDVTRCL